MGQHTHWICLNLNFGTESLSCYLLLEKNKQQITRHRFSAKIQIGADPMSVLAHLTTDPPLCMINYGLYEQDPTALHNAEEIPLSMRIFKTFLHDVKMR